MSITLDLFAPKSRPPKRVVVPEFIKAQFRSTPPPRKAVGASHGKPPVRRHYAFKGATTGKSIAPRRRVRFQPQLIDAALFIVDPLRRFPEWPLICKTANLPAFENKKDLSEFLNHFVNPANFHPTTMLAQWRCHACRRLHFWTSGAQTDSNGTPSAGANKIPRRIQTLILRAIK